MDKYRKALTWNELADYYPGNARIRPMQEVFDWAANQKDKFIVHPDNKTIHLINKKENIEVVNIRCYRPMKNHVRIYIGRQSSWIKASKQVKELENYTVLGNPFLLIDNNNDEQRNKSINNYKIYFDKNIIKQGEFRKAVGNIWIMYKNNEEIKLVCHCAPKACHGDVIKEFIEMY